MISWYKAFSLPYKGRVRGGVIYGVIRRVRGAIINGVTRRVMVGAFLFYHYFPGFY